MYICTLMNCIKAARAVTFSCAMSVQHFIDYLKINLTCAGDRDMCLRYTETLVDLTPFDLEYARGMVDRWVSVGMFHGRIATSSPFVDMPPHDAGGEDVFMAYGKRPAESEECEAASAKRQRCP